MLHLTDTPAGYLTQPPPTAQALVVEVRAHLDALYRRMIDREGDHK